MATTSIDGSADPAPAGGGGDPPATAAAAAAAAAASAASAPGALYYESFTDEGLKTSQSIQNFKTPEELARGYVSLEKRFGIDPARRLDLPADLTDAKAMREVYTRLGLPEKPDGYGLTIDDKASDAEKAMLGKAAEKFHELGLPPGMAKGVVEWWQGEQTAALQAAEAADTARISEGKAALQTELGAAFEARTKEVRDLIGKEFGPELAEAMKDDALYRYPALVKGLAKIVERMAEPGGPGGGSGDAFTGDRPLSPAQAQAQVNALTSDPVKGKALLDNTHPMHKEVVAERARLLRMVHGVAA